MCKKVENERLRQLTDSNLKLDTVYSHLPAEDILKQRLILKMEFDLLSTRQTENLILKSQHSSYEHGDKAGKILAHQLRQRTANQYISEISDEQGLKHTKHSKINSCFHRYYSSLYTSEPPGDETPLERFFHNFDIPRIYLNLAA